MRARPAEDLAGSGFTPGAPAVGVALTSADLAKWAGEVKAEYARVNASFDEKLTVSGSEAVPSACELATACAD